MKYIKAFENYEKSISSGQNTWDESQFVVCDESVYPLVTSHFKDATIYGRDSNSGVISTIKSLITKGHNNIIYVIDDASEISDGKRLEFMKDFMGKDFEKITVLKSSTIKNLIKYKRN